MEIIIGSICFILFLFNFYVLAKDDFVFLRKNVTIEQLFNTIFLSLPIIFFFSRLAYVLFHPQWKYINPLVFFIVPYFPGLSVGGGILGALLFFSIYTKNRKIPFLRLLDELSLSFLFASSVYFLLQGTVDILAKHLSGYIDIGMWMLYIIGFFLSRSLFRSERWSDGAMSALTLIMYSLFGFLYLIVLLLMKKTFLLTPEDIFYGVILLMSIVFFMKTLFTYTKGRKA